MRATKRAAGRSHSALDQEERTHAPRRGSRGDARVVGLAGRGPGVRGCGAGVVPSGRTADTGPPQWDARAVLGVHPVPEHDPAAPTGAPSRGSGDRAPDPVGDPLERGRDRAAREQGVLGAGRAHRLVPVGGDAVRHRVPAFLARPQRGARRRPGVLPGARVARDLRAVVPGGTADRGAADQFRQEVGGKRVVVLPAPVADAGLLAVPDGVDGPRPDRCRSTRHGS